MTNIWQASFASYDFDSACTTYPPKISYDYLCTDTEFVTRIFHNELSCGGDASQQDTYQWDKCEKNGNYYTVMKVQ